MQFLKEEQEESEYDRTGANQHGFKRNRITTNLFLHLQSIIARALHNVEYMLLVSLD
jgi:hypothetical protein